MRGCPSRRLRPHHRIRSGPSWDLPGVCYPDVKTFLRPTPRVIILAGMPRSGTTWLGHIFDSHPDVAYRVCPLFCHSLKNALSPASERAEWERVLRLAFHEPSEYMLGIQGRRAGELPPFTWKSVPPTRLVLKFDRHQNLVRHALRHFPDLSVVGIVRHPCAAIDSWLRTPKEFPSDADPLAHWRSGAVKKRWPGDHFGFDDWVWLTNELLDLERVYPERVEVVRYEAMVRAGAEAATALLERCGLPAHSRITAFVEESQSRHSSATHGVFKNPSVVDAWQGRLLEPIRRAIEQELRGSHLERFLADVPAVRSSATSAEGLQAER